MCVFSHITKLLFLFSSGYKGQIVLKLYSIFWGYFENFTKKYFLRQYQYINNNVQLLKNVGRNIMWRKSMVSVNYLLFSLKSWLKKNNISFPTPLSLFNASLLRLLSIHHHMSKTSITYRNKISVTVSKLASIGTCSVNAMYLMDE